jgi:hypothetical protein
MLIKLGYLSAAAQYDIAVNNRFLKNNEPSKDKSNSSNYETSTTQTTDKKKKSKGIE